MRDRKTNFSAPIPQDLKDRIDDLILKADIPIGRVVRRLAEYCSQMTPTQLRSFVYGESVTLEESIQQGVTIFLRSPAGRELIAELVVSPADKAEARQVLDRSEQSSLRGTPEPDHRDARAV